MKGRPTRCWIARAYGLYPPGSTFKLLTAAAALRRDPGAAAQTFTCSRLPDNRVGVHAAGLPAPIRDDVMDKQPHGTIDMHRALVVSCNAYFAQLAVRLGPQAAARGGAAGRDLARAKQRRVSHPRHASAGRLRTGRSGGVAAAHGAPLRQRSQPTAAFATCGCERWTPNRVGAPVPSS